MKLFFLIIITSFSFCLQAQNNWWNKKKDKTPQKKVEVQKKPMETVRVQPSNQTQMMPTDTLRTTKPGNITIHKSSLVTKVIQFKSAEIPPYSRATMNGYRIQLFFDQQKSKVDSARAVILQMNNDARTYVKYMAPNYYLFEGDYRSKLDAEKNRANWLGDFPTAIVKETTIFLPPINTDKKKDSSQEDASEH